MSRQSIKNKLNKILRQHTQGFFTDDYWQPVTSAFNALKEAGYPVMINETKYRQDDKGNPCEKVWFFEIEYSIGHKPFYGVLTAHGAGTVKEPLSRYDISAYIS